MTDVLQKLQGGDLRSIGRVGEVVDDVLGDPSLFGSLFDGILGDDPIVRMRSADAAEKITVLRPEYLQPYKTELIGPVAVIEQQEVRWHVAQMIPRLDLSEEERAAAAEILLEYLSDKSRIVRTFSMQALADLALRDSCLRGRVIPVLEELSVSGSPAMRSRGRKLLRKLGRSTPDS